MSKRIILLLILGIVFISIIPFLVTEHTQKSLSGVMEMYSAISSVLTLVVALLLYNKYGIEQTLLEKQSNAVFILLSELKKINFLIRGQGFYFFFRPEKKLMIDRFNSKVRFYDSSKEMILVFSFNAIKATRKIDEACENILMPPEILKSYESIRLWYIFAISDSELKTGRYLKVDIDFENKTTQKDSYGIPGGNGFSLEQYYERWSKFIQVVEMWLQNNSSLKIDLNI